MSIPWRQKNAFVLFGKGCHPSIHTQSSFGSCYNRDHEISSANREDPNVRDHVHSPWLAPASHGCSSQSWPHSQRPGVLDGKGSLLREDGRGPVVADHCKGLTCASYDLLFMHGARDNLSAQLYNFASAPHGSHFLLPDLMHMSDASLDRNTSLRWRREL